VSNEQRSLHRVVSLPGAVLLGLGSILGTGVFVSIGIGAGVAGNALLLAVALAAVVAACNALSSAQLAAAHPVSGGTYEYGYRWLSPSLGFAAGWMFLCAKSFSAATAALGFAGYALRAAPGVGDGIDLHRWKVLLALVGVLALTALVLTGMRRSSRVNAAIVSVTLASLAAFCVFGLRDAAGRAEVLWKPTFFGVEGDDRPALVRLLEATALMFVAYTGYGRLATLGEEVREPRKTIPRAIIATLVVSAAIYMGVSFVALGTLGPVGLAEAARTSAAPLEEAARHFDGEWIAEVVAIGAVAAMLGVLLNLILGLSRVALAMGRRDDLPRVLARVGANGSPNAAVVGVGLAIAAIALIGDVKLTWSFSAFTVLVYYAITNLAAIRLTREERLYPAWIAWAGLIACLSLAFFVEARVWMMGLGLIGVGFVVRAVVRKIHRRGR
jgi:APA family basic amino acid/polyamine antiporter